MNPNIPTGRFVKTQDIMDAKLEYNNKTYPNYMIINHEPNPLQTQLTLASIPGTAGCFTQIHNRFLPFQVSGLLLNNYLQAKYLHLMTPDFLLEDCLKAMICEIGIIAIHCKQVGLAVDFTRVYLTQTELPQVKAIAVKESKESTESLDVWKGQLINTFIDIVKVCRGCYPSSNSSTKQDVAFNWFVNELRNSTNLGEIETVFRSHYFWTKCTKFSVISSFNDMIKRHPGELYKYNPSIHLKNWRSTMRNDLNIQASINEFGAGDDKIEVDLLLVWLRFITEHFHQANLSFANKDETLDYMERQFPEIMLAVYTGATLMVEDEIWVFKVGI